jgi:hypothetical protein
MKKYLKAKMNEETSKRMEIGARPSGWGFSTFVRGGWPPLRGAVQPAILNPPFPILALAVSMQ